MRLLLATAAAAALVAGALPALAQTRIGSAAAISNSVNGSLGKTERSLKAGDGVFQDETVATGKDGNASLLFVDETTLSIGPDSKVVLDKVVFDPEKKTGEVTIRAVTGAFRFVTGSAQKDAYTIKTPSGTIGIRGSIILFNIVGNILTLTVLEGGAQFCLTPSQCTVLDKPGTYIVVTGTQMSAIQILNALGCGAGRCNETSYNQGDQTTYVTFFADNSSTPPPGSPGENQFQQALRAYLARLLAKVERALEHTHLHGHRLEKVIDKIDRLNQKVDNVLIPALDTQWELFRDKRIVRHYVEAIFDIIYRHHHHYGHHHHFSHHHHHRHHRHRHRHRDRD